MNILLILLSLSKVKEINSSSFQGPSKWSILVPTYCNGTSQSPINIDTKKVIYNPALKPLVLVNYTKSFPGVTLDMGNNGNTAYAWAKVDNTLSDVPIGIKWNGM